MQRIARFEKVSDAQMKADSAHMAGEPLPVELPVRATAGSAGYDIKTPWAIRLEPGKSIRIPTGLRCRIEPGWVLLIMPKSGLGFKYRLQLDNTVGVVDEDYYGADNEGHIQIQITNDSREGKALEIPAGKAFAQGLFVPYGITEDDEAEAKRTGGFGSTNA
ncbi:MAG: deoxyuridine 5'-triphosphate nucleotidohydrolase [Firmicutes bacterium]|nr:deoxyuridine 5'-triphosphate nucleotidohydrolase [Bacillota bacterium]